MEEKLYHIGRDNNKNEIFINDDSISLSHAQVYLDKNIEYIKYSFFDSKRSRIS